MRTGKPVLDESGQQIILPKTATDHSGRLFLGLRHAFNKDVTLALGAEYLQSVVDSTRYRFNFDALFAAKVGGGLAVGLGFSARYDHDPLPGKEDLDTSTTLNLIYAFSDVPEPPPAPCACPPPPPEVPAPSPAAPPEAPAACAAIVLGASLSSGAAGRFGASGLRGFESQVLAGATFCRSCTGQLNRGETQVRSCRGRD